MTHNIIMSDDDLLFMEDETGDIAVSLELFADTDITPEDIIYIMFEEDPDSIKHKYQLKDVDKEKNQVNLHWIEQLGEALLTEANPLSKLGNTIRNYVTGNSLEKKMTRAEKRAEKDTEREAAKKERAVEKLRKDGEKLILRDLSAEAKSWQFYLQKPDGSYTDALAQDSVQVKNAYNKVKSGNITSEVGNALVVTPDGYFVRRGLEDLYRKGIVLNGTTAQLDPDYTLPLDTAEEEKADVEQDASVQETPTENTTEQQPEEKTKTPNNRYDLGISSNTYGHFLKLLYVMRPNLYDAFNKPVDVSNIKTLQDKVKYNNLADFEIEIDGRKIPVINWIKTAVKNKVLMEKVLNEAPMISLDSDDLMNPDNIDFKSKIRHAKEKEAAEVAKAERDKLEAVLKDEAETILDKLNKSMKDNELPVDILEELFDGLVPSSGAAATVAGELVRATMRILYRDANDGDKFFEGYGLETCGSSAQFLFDNGFEEDIQNILDQAVYLSEDDEEYTDAVTLLAEHVVNHIYHNNELMWTINEEDSRDYPYDYIEENQPMYELEFEAPYDVQRLVNKGIIDSWDLNRYVEESMEYDGRYKDAEVSIPWSTHSTSVTVQNLTREGYDALRDAIRDEESYWATLVEEHSSELEDSEYDDEYDD